MASVVQIELPQQKIADFCKRWQITEFSLFGSVLREDFRPDSDIDVLVSFAPDARYGLFDIMQMEDELTEVLGRKVELVERKALERSENYIRRRHILKSIHTIHVA